MKNTFIFFISIILFVNCDNTKQDDYNIDIDEVELTLENNNNDFTYEAITLPTPIQFASILKAYNFNYNNLLLNPINNNIYKSKTGRAIFAGIYSVNLGYTITNKDKESSLIYFKQTSNLFNDLGFVIPEKDKNYFSENIDNPDSLYFVFLKNYNNIHEYFIKYDEKETGLNIISGCYIESLRMLLETVKNYKDKTKGKLYKSLMGQQKIFLQNILYLYTQIENNKSKNKDVIKILNQINEKLSKLEIKEVNNRYTVTKMPLMTDINYIINLIDNFKQKL